MLRALLPVDPLSWRRKSRMVLSSKYQVVIPPKVRRAFKLMPGRKIEVAIHDWHITLVASGSLRALRGSAKGIDTRVPRAEGRR